jgi:hypothetical protein
VFVRQLRDRIKHGPPAPAVSPEHVPPAPVRVQAPANAGQAGRGGIGGAVRLVGGLLGFSLWSSERTKADGARSESESGGDQDVEKVGGMCSLVLKIPDEHSESGTTRLLAISKALCPVDDVF